MQFIVIIIYNSIMYVCICNAIKESQVVSSVQEGNNDLDSVSADLGVGMYCGSCVHVVKALIDEAKDRELSSSNPHINQELTGQPKKLNPVRSTLT